MKAMGREVSGVVSKSILDTDDQYWQPIIDQFMTISRYFSPNMCYYKVEVKTVILRCLMGVKCNCF